MRRHGLEAELRVIPGEHTEESGIEAGHLLLAERDRGQSLPTAVLAGNDRCAWGVLMTLTRDSVDVPRDVSVVGYDDSHLSYLMPIGLTTVRQDAVLMAEHAVRFAAAGPARAGLSTLLGRLPVPMATVMRRRGRGERGGGELSGARQAMSAACGVACGPPRSLYSLHRTHTWPHEPL